jgi:REP element-mobilizing transposase RayT
MPHTYSTNLVHCIFSTKNRADSIPDDTRGQLYAYLAGVARNLEINILEMGGTANHIHMLIAVPPKRPLSDLVRDLKANSSRWMSENGPRFSWQEGFGAFSVSPSQVAAVKTYIQKPGCAPQKAEFRGRVSVAVEEIGD